MEDGYFLNIHITYKNDFVVILTLIVIICCECLTFSLRRSVKTNLVSPWNVGTTLKDMLTFLFRTVCISHNDSLFQPIIAKKTTVREVINVRNYITTSLLHNFLMQHGKDLKCKINMSWSYLHSKNLHI